MRSKGIFSRIVTACCYLVPATLAYGQQALKYNFEYRCNGEVVVISGCRRDGDQLGMRPTPDGANYCTVYYPDRPKPSGITITAAELRNDIEKKLQSCGAIASNGSTSEGTGNVSDADAKASLGRQFYKEKDYKSALDLFNQALSLEPNNVMANRGLAQMSEDQKQWPMVIAARKRLAIAIPDDTANLRLLGEAQRQAKLYDDALATVARANRLKPEDVNYYLIGMVYNDLKQYDKAVPAFQESLRLNPTQGNVGFQLGLAFYNLKQYQQAIDTFRLSISLKVANPHFVYGWIGETYYVLKQWEKALPEYKEAIRLKPDYANAYSQLGNCHYFLKQYEEALAAHQSAYRLNPGDAGNLRNIGDTYVKLGRKADALAVYQKLKTLDPVSAQVLLDRINSLAGQPK